MDIKRYINVTDLQGNKEALKDVVQCAKDYWDLEITENEAFDVLREMTAKGQRRGTPRNRNYFYIITIHLHFTLLIVLTISICSTVCWPS